MDTSGAANDFAIRLPLLECDAVMVCFELGNSTSFGNAIAHWLYKISKLGNKVTPIVLVGLKMDLCEPDEAEK